MVDHSPAGRRPQWPATEYVPAPSPADRVERHGPLPEAGVRALAAELAEALRAVHRAGPAHRDVEPSGIPLGRRHPPLIDFGIARAADDTRRTLPADPRVLTGRRPPADAPPRHTLRAGVRPVRVPPASVVTGRRRPRRRTGPRP
ncbi:hypothetical protein ABZ915_02885 [Streptomyces sp. NPDC046915]|uniref:protein kinase domain-containing protein n=1 Tax=Streptomyces sp. NPDC046915 TaxID=3155257 RepID=UPI0033C387AB